MHKSAHSLPTALLLTALTMCAACGQVADDERLIYVPRAEVQRAVLIEDFTGQRCINCPEGSAVIASLQEQYGEDNVVAVGIHSGPFGVNQFGVNLPLTTDVGRAYFDYWHLDGQPVALINRQAPTTNYDTWGADVRRELEKPATLSLSAGTLRATADSISIDGISAVALSGDVAARLTVWLIEDSIVGTQYLPGNSIDRDYMHRHVFRDTVNGMWGQAVLLAQDVPQTFSFAHARAAAWDVRHLAAVVFVADASGVLQVATAHCEPRADDAQQ